MHVKKRVLLSAGFTLIELLVVVVIIGLLAAYVGPRYFAQLSQSEIKTAGAQIQAFARALHTYRLDTGHYPSSTQGLAALLVQPSDELHWNGPYLERRIPPDPWGHSYVYVYPGKTSDFDLYSTGPNGKWSADSQPHISYQ